MRTMTAAFIMVLAATASGPAGAADTLRGIKADCTADWPGNYRMQEFCINNQVESFNGLVRISNNAQNDDEKAILQKCLADWGTANGSNWRMVKFCYDQQHEAYKRLGGG